MTELQDEVRQVLRTAGLKLNMDLGQHFLVDEDVLETIVETADIKETDHIVEIGPGIGILTRELLRHAGHVTVIELDTRMIPVMKKYLEADPESSYTEHLTIIRNNALQTPLPETPYKIVANIPYHITSPLIRHAYLESVTPPGSMTLLIQREVAEKICDTKHAGILTIMVGLFGTPSVICKVQPHCFLPPPAVDSAVLRIISHPKPLTDRDTIDQVLRLVKIGFSGKRKMLSNTIGNMPDGMELLKKSGIDPMRRPDTLSVQEWIILAGCFLQQETSKNI